MRARSNVGRLMRSLCRALLPIGAAVLIVAIVLGASRVYRAAYANRLPNGVVVEINWLIGKKAEAIFGQMWITEDVPVLEDAGATAGKIIFGSAPLKPNELPVIIE